MEKISVAVRFRPSTGEDAASARYWKVDNNNVTLHKSLGSPVAGVSFSYDHVFDHSCNNLTIYNVLTKSIIDAAVNGFNGTAFAYGQTSSGKTYTMNGSENDPGIIQLAVNDVFSSIEKIREREFLIRVSYMEIYNEEINDLLAVENQKLQIHESLDRGIFVAGLREEIVDSAEQVSKLLMLGEANRHFGETNMNIRSSRSHTIFRMVIESRAKDTQLSCDFPGADSIRVSVLNLVDLAGSERIAKTGADGVRLKEGKHINKSLMALGNVINKLSDGGKQKGHIPYRDSKLTRILQPALGGNAKTSIVCTVAPEELHIEETRGTLQFASRAKRITNCAQVNEILTDAALLKRQKLEIEELRKKLQGSHSELLEQVILKQRNDMLKSELECEKLAIQLEQEKRSREALENKVKEQQMMIDSLKNLTCFSEVPRNLTQECVPTRQLSINDDVGGDDDHDDDDGDDDDCLLKKSNLRTPDFGNLPCEFVTRRRDYSTAPNFCPLAETLGNNTDEDTWLHLNGGFSADLNMLQLTPEQGPQKSLMVFQEQRRCPDAETCDALERECSQLREDKSSLMDALASSKEMTELLNAQKEELRAELDAERLKMKDLREEIRSFDELLSKRDGLLQSLYTRSQVIVGNLRGHHQW